MKKRNKNKKSKPGNYSAIYLGVILAFVLLLEGFLMGVATAGDWQRGLEVLDVSHEVKVVAADVFALAEPFFMIYDDVNSFYQLAATETMALFDVSEQDPFAFFRGVNNFYKLASAEMEQVLDFSNQFGSLGEVAGAYISR